MNAPLYVGHFYNLDNTLRTITFRFADEVKPWMAKRQRPQRENIPVDETHALVVEYLDDGKEQYRHVNLSNGFYKRVDNG